MSYVVYIYTVLHVKDGVVHRRRQQSLVAETEVTREVWAGLQDKVQRVACRESGTRKGLCELLEKQTAELSAVDDELGEDSLQIVYAKMLRALCSQLGLGLGPGNGIISVFFSLCVKVTKTCVLLVAVQRSDVRPTLCDVMMMYSQDRYMKNLPLLAALAQIHNHARTNTAPFLPFMRSTQVERCVLHLLLLNRP